MDAILHSFLAQTQRLLRTAQSTTPLWRAAEATGPVWRCCVAATETGRIGAVNPPEHRDRPDIDVGAHVDAVLRASRVLVGVAASSIAAIEDVITVPQLRILVMIDTRGPLGLGAVADALGVDPSNASRACDRLIRAGLLVRRVSTADRRSITWALIDSGKTLVDSVNDHRRSAIGDVLQKMSPRDRDRVARALADFAAAAGEPSGNSFLGLFWPD
ncbi:MarR family transcriptional regulator [Rhodococcus fascians]|nr:MarR family transcriptional regulator [Rhodococcus fascians]MBY4238689.1 MarR family transcriptional regulator [Rhodococcus fascians]MBY4254722.1 MarR family transcriptional regulator [Rhodococcus fascians]MBY4270044.1 MarR family transcriptional regulator [Rhodococcus fascians]